ncbi:hypothetical protein [Lysobacter terrae]
MDRSAIRNSTSVLLCSLLVACRWQSSTPTTETTGQFGGGTGTYTAQCSGDFPDWISDHQPQADASGDVNPNEPGVQKSFQLAQAYPLGVPVITNDAQGQPHITSWNPPAAETNGPWRTFSNLSIPAQRDGYLAALKAYILQGMSDPGIDFNAVKNNSNWASRKWYHVPMMTASANARREPYHGVTSERPLKASEQTHWLTSGGDLRAVAVGYYNSLGGYTIGQVFPSYDLAQTSPSAAHFIDGTVVFKLLFAEYVPSRIQAPDPLAHAPRWFVQVPSNSAAPPIEVRLLQVDIAVKDDHFSGKTGWVFATYAYDERQWPAEANAWRRLTPIGVQWGNDPTVTGTAITTLQESWINPDTPPAFRDHVGRAGRLIGPVDNPRSSCLSCHSTAQVDMAQVGNVGGMFATQSIPPTSCSTPMAWFRNLSSGPSGSTAFGRMPGNNCPVDVATTGLTSLDYSLQLQVGVVSVFGFQNPNPCADYAQAHYAATNAMALRRNQEQMRQSPDRERHFLRELPAQSQRVKITRDGKLFNREIPPEHRR